MLFGSLLLVSRLVAWLPNSTGLKIEGLSVHSSLHMLFLACLTASLPEDSLRIRGAGVPEFGLPLKSLDLQVVVLENIAQTVFTLEYFNPADSALEEAILNFPYDPAMAVSNVMLESGNRTFFSQAFERVVAQDDYNEQKKSNHTALLVQRSTHGDCLAIDLAILPAKSNLTVTLTASSVMPTQFDAKRERWYSHYVLPASFVPRYSPPDFDASKLRSPVSSGAESEFEFSFHISAPFAEKVSSFSYPSAILHDGKKLSYNGKITKDLIVDITHPKAPNPTVEVFGESQVTQFVINGMAMPIVDDKRKNTSIIFLIDRSGSMEGRPIAHVRSPLSVFMHSLPPDCYFDLIGFGWSHSSCFGGLTAYNDESLAPATRYISELGADFGGTEIYGPLQYVLTDIRPDLVFLLTDGAVSNTEMVLGLGREANCPISTFGIGNAASVDLVRGLADLTGGTHEFVDDPSRIEESVIRSLRTALHPLLRDIQLESDCGTLDKIGGCFGCPILEN
jgi:hypothetical protein